MLNSIKLAAAILKIVDQWDGGNYHKCLTVPLIGGGILVDVATKFMPTDGGMD